MACIEAHLWPHWADRDSVVSGLTNLQLTQLLLKESPTPLPAFPATLRDLTINDPAAQQDSDVPGLCDMLMGIMSLNGLTRLELADIAGKHNFHNHHLAESLQDACSTRGMSLELLTTLRHLDISNTFLTVNDCVSGLGELVHLTDLSLSHQDLYNSGQCMRNLTNLECLCFWDMTVVNPCIEWSAFKRLRHLDLSYTRYAIEVAVADMDISFENIQSIATTTPLLQALPLLSSLESLNLSGFYPCTRLDNLTCLTALTRLDLTQWSNVLDFSCLSQLPSLKHLCLVDCDIPRNHPVVSSLTHLECLL